MNGNNLILLIGAFLFLTHSILYAQDSIRVQPRAKKQFHKFVDKNGDGYNDNAPDHDGDGIPNGLDPDWLKQKHKKRPAFRDLDGDGINDFLQDHAKQRFRHFNGRRPRIRMKFPDQKSAGSNSRRHGHK